MSNQTAVEATTGFEWKRLYRIGAVAAWITAVCVPIQIAILILWPPPAYQPTVSAVTGWFTLLQGNRLIGLLDLDLLLIVDQALFVPILLAVYVALRRANESLMALATVLGLLGAMAFFAASPTFSMPSLSDGYAAAATDAQRSTFVAAGQAVMAASQGTSFHIYYILGSIAPIMFSVVMLRTTLFSKTTAILGIAANAIALGFYLPAVGIFLSIASVVVLEVWYILIGLRLLTLGQTA